jgi:hypothetical protein
MSKVVLTTQGEDEKQMFTLNMNQMTRKILNGERETTTMGSIKQKKRLTSQ